MSAVAHQQGWLPGVGWDVTGGDTRPLFRLLSRAKLCKHVLELMLRRPPQARGVIDILDGGQAPSARPMK